MKTYIIKETENLNSEREGYSVAVKDLAAAKRKATRSKCFFGTTLKIENENGELIAYKEKKEWIHV